MMYRISIFCGVLLLLLGSSNSQGSDMGKQRTGETETPEVYALLKIHYRRPVILRDDRTHKPDLDEFNLYKRSQQVLIKSNLVIVEALRIDDISDIPIIRSQERKLVPRWLSGKLQVDFPNDADIMRIGMSGEDVRVMKRIVDAIVEAYLREIVVGERSAMLYREDILQLALAENRETIRKRRVIIAHYKHALSDKDGEPAMPGDTLELDAGKSDLAYLERFNDTLRSELDRLKLSLRASTRIVLLQKASQ